jgi:tetratricopeptide (TPR) repeat protein
MKTLKRQLVFSLLFFILVFTAVVNVNGQESYNYYALEYFKKSLEYLVVGDYDNTIVNCNQVLMRDPNSAVTYTIRARAYYEKGNTAKAIEDCNQAIRIDRNNVSAYSIRGNSYILTGDRTRALRDWQTVLRLSPDNPEAKRNIELAGQPVNSGY